MSLWQQLWSLGARIGLVGKPLPIRPPVAWRQSLQPLPICRTVLVVDDDAAMLELIIKILSTENYEILSAGSGDYALEMLDRTGIKIDLLITDYVMPRMNGCDLAEQLRKRFPDVKVLHQTGFSELLFSGRTEVEPNAAFIEKPFTARGLLEAARLVLFGTIHFDQEDRAA